MCKFKRIIFILMAFILFVLAGCSGENQKSNLTDLSSKSVKDNSAPAQMGQFSSMDEYVQQLMEQEETAEYYSASKPGAGDDRLTEAKVLDTKLARLEKRGELDDLAPEGTLEAWSYKYLVKIDAPTEDVLLVGGQNNDEEYYDLEGQNGHIAVALRYEDGSYDVLYDDISGDGLDFFGYRETCEEAIYDWYVAENNLDLPLYVEDWSERFTPPEGGSLGNYPVHRFDGNGWYIYIPVSAWVPAEVPLEYIGKQWIWKSEYNTGSTLTVDWFSVPVEDQYAVSTKQGYTAIDETKQAWENHAGGVSSYYYFSEDIRGGCWRVTIEWIDANITDYPNIAMEPDVLRLMAESFTADTLTTSTIIESKLSLKVSGHTSPEEAATDLAALFMDALTKEDNSRTYRVTEYKDLSVSLFPTKEVDEETAAIYALRDNEISEKTWIVEISVLYKYEGVLSPIGPSNGEWIDVLYQASPIGFLMEKDGDTYSLQPRYQGK